MAFNENADTRNWLVRTVLAVVLAVVAVRSFQKGRRLSAALAGVGALALGYDPRGESSEPTEMFDLGATGQDAELRCAICGEPIRPGQSRGPNEDNEIVHDACM